MGLPDQRCPSAPPQSRFLERYWSARGALLGALGVALRLYWTPHGALLGDVGVAMKRLEGHRGETAGSPAACL
eukprot:4510743-Pyramimonas_sp.AAC.1